METYTLKQIEEAMRKCFVHSSETLGVEIITKSSEGTWFDELFKDFKESLNKIKNEKQIHRRNKKLV